MYVYTIKFAKIYVYECSTIALELWTLKLMPRGPRLDAPGTLHHVIVRGIERRKIVDNDILIVPTDFLEIKYPQVFHRHHLLSLLFRMHGNHLSDLLKKLHSFFCCFDES